MLHKLIGWNTCCYDVPTEMLTSLPSEKPATVKMLAVLKTTAATPDWAVGKSLIQCWLLKALLSQVITNLAVKAFFHDLHENISSMHAFYFI